MKHKDFLRIVKLFCMIIILQLWTHGITNLSKCMEFAVQGVNINV